MSKIDITCPPSYKRAIFNHKSRTVQAQEWRGSRANGRGRSAREWIFIQRQSIGINWIQVRFFSLNSFESGRLILVELLCCVMDFMFIPSIFSRQTNYLYGILCWYIWNRYLNLYRYRCKANFSFMNLGHDFR